ncbi:hypothetical protein CBL_03459 [Carabus blaptoides fortunei]
MGRGGAPFLVGRPSVTLWELDKARAGIVVDIRHTRNLRPRGSPKLYDTLTELIVVVDAMDVPPCKHTLHAHQSSDVIVTRQLPQVYYTLVYLLCDTRDFNTHTLVRVPDGVWDIFACSTASVLQRSLVVRDLSQTNYREQGKGQSRWDVVFKRPSPPSLQNPSRARRLNIHVRNDGLIAEGPRWSLNRRNNDKLHHYPVISTITFGPFAFDRNAAQTATHATQGRVRFLSDHTSRLPLHFGGFPPSVFLCMDGTNDGYRTFGIFFLVRRIYLRTPLSKDTNHRFIHGRRPGRANVASNVLSSSISVLAVEALKFLKSHIHIVIGRRESLVTRASHVPMATLVLGKCDNHVGRSKNCYSAELKRNVAHAYWDAFY